MVKKRQNGNLGQKLAGEWIFSFKFPKYFGEYSRNVGVINLGFDINGDFCGWGKGMEFEIYLSGGVREDDSGKMVYVGIWNKSGKSKSFGTFQLIYIEDGESEILKGFNTGLLDGKIREQTEFSMWRVKE